MPKALKRGPMPAQDRFSYSVGTRRRRPLRASGDSTRDMALQGLSAVGRDGAWAPGPEGQHGGGQQVEQGHHGEEPALRPGEPTDEADGVGGAILREAVNEMNSHGISCTVI